MTYPFTDGETGHLEEHDRVYTELVNHETRIAGLEAGGGGGGGTGTVTSVNSEVPDVAGNVALTVSDIPNAVASTDARMSNARTPTAHESTHALAGADPLHASEIAAIAAVVRNEVAGTYAARSTVSSDITKPIWWIGSVAPAIGSGFAVNNLDLWLQTP